METLAQKINRVLHFKKNCTAEEICCSPTPVAEVPVPTAPPVPVNPPVPVVPVPTPVVQPPQPIAPTPVVPTPVAEVLVYRAIKCGTLEEYFIQENILGLIGAVVKASNGLCYTILNSQIGTASLTVLTAFLSCASCQATPTPLPVTCTNYLIDPIIGATDFTYTNCDGEEITGSTSANITVCAVTGSVVVSNAVVSAGSVCQPTPTPTVPPTPVVSPVPVIPTPTVPPTPVVSYDCTRYLIDPLLGSTTYSYDSCYTGDTISGSTSVNLEICAITGSVVVSNATVTASGECIDACVSISIKNNSGVSTDVTFTQCDGYLDSYTLPAGETSPVVCCIDANAFTVSQPNVIIYRGGNCSSRSLPITGNSFRILSNEGINGVRKYNPNGTTAYIKMKLAQVSAGHITDEAFSYNPYGETVWWKINKELNWRSTPLTNFEVPVELREAPLVITKIIFGSGASPVTTEFHPRIVVSQHFIIY